MKWLAGVTALQLLVIGILLVRLEAIESRLASLAATGLPQGAIGERLTDTAVQVRHTRSSCKTDEAVLRRVINQELSALFAAGGAPADDEPAVAVSDAAETGATGNNSDHYQLDLVRGELDYYTSRGVITEMEMVELQSLIASLPAQQRTRMLQQLARALSSGDLQGRL